MTIKSIIGSDILLDESGWGWEWLQTLDGSILTEWQLGIDTFFAAIWTEVGRVYCCGPSPGKERFYWYQYCEDPKTG